MAAVNVPNVYCSLCGVILAVPDPTIVNLPKSQRPWYYDSRAIFKDGQEPGFTLSGVGYLVSRGTLAASRNSEDPFPSSLPNDRISLNKPVGRFWGYGFHNDCWMLLLEKLSHSYIVDESTIVKIIHLIFYYTECPGFSAFSFGHNYGGVAELQDPYGDLHGVPLHLPESANPSMLPSREHIDEYASVILNAKTLNNFAQPNFVRSGAQGISPIHKLPPEIIYLIIRDLKIADVVNFRLTCQDFTWKANPLNFPPSFWKTRFLPGFELEYVLPGTTVEPTIDTGYWFTFFCGVMAHIHIGYKPLANKKRIWDILEHIVRWVKLAALESRLWYGRRFATLETPTWESEDMYEVFGDSGEARVLTAEHLLRGLVVREAHETQLTEGCKALIYMASSFGPRIGEARVISVSTIEFGEKCYISGFGTSYSEGNRGIGMLIPEREELIHFPNYVLVESIEVAFRPSGLAGMRFLCTDNYKSQWVGQNKGPGIARGIIRLFQNGNEINIVGAMDPYKIVSLSSVKSFKKRKAARYHVLDLRQNKTTSFRSYLWSSEMPDCLDVRLSSIVPPLPFMHFDPLINIDFGGRGGVFLKLLSKMTVHMISEWSPIVGLEFGYGNESTKLFGSKGRNEASTLIDGPGGERITSIDVFTERLRAKVLGLRVKTNRDRSTVLTPLQYSLDTRGTSYNLDSLRNKIITGFVATQSKDEMPHHFERMGLQYQRGENPGNPAQCSKP